MSEDACTNSSSPPYLLEPSNTHMSTAHEVIHVQRCGSYIPRCGSLPGGLWHIRASNRNQLHQTWTSASRMTSSNVKSDFPCYSVTLSFVSTTAIYYARFILLKLTVCFQKFTILPFLPFNLFFCWWFSSFLVSLNRFGENAILSSSGWSTQPHTWHTGSCHTNCCYPGYLAQSWDYGS